MKLISIFGSVAIVEILASLFCLQRLKIWLAAMVSNVCWALVRDLDNIKWETGVKIVNGSRTVCVSKYLKYFIVTYTVYSKICPLPLTHP